VQVGGEGEGIDCGTTTTEVAYSADAGDGRTGDQGLALLAGPVAASPVWFDGRDEGLTLTAEPIGSTVEVLSHTNPDPQCQDSIRLDVLLTLTSADGTL
jgi:hypothetical protein